MKKWICSVFLVATLFLGVTAPTSTTFTISIEEVKPSDKNDVT